MQNKLLEFINNILKNKDKVELKTISDKDHLRDDIGLDSLDLAELTVRIESEYGVDVFEEGLVNTVGEILNKIDNHEK